MRFWILTLLFMSIEAYGQNLIPDPYFNYVPNCSVRPTGDFSQSWYSPTGYQYHAYHLCIGNIPYSPDDVNHEKYQKVGKGMMSISLLSDVIKEHKSYIATRLSTPLKKGHTYYIRFYISPKKEKNNSRNMVANVIGLYLSFEKVQQDILTTLPFIAQVERLGTFFEDYNQWYKIEGKFVAQGGEKYAIIGNFRSDKESNYKYTNPDSGSAPNIAHIFIDDVLLEAFDPLADTILLCNRQSITLNAGFHEARYEWNTGERDSLITVNRSGIYTVRATIDTLKFQDSTEVIFMDDFSPENTIDTFFCEGSDLVLGVPVPGNYQWSNGETNSSLTVRDEGMYRLNVDNKCGTYQFTYHVTELDCNCELVLPSAFSPNGDHQNDLFTVIDQCRNGKWSMGSFRVYNKWGGIVYQEFGQNVSWNGQSSGGEELPPGVYTYRLEAKIQEGNEEESIVKTGSVHLLR